MVMTAEHKNYYLHKDNVPLLRYDGKSDFSEWQKTAKAKLRELLGFDNYKLCDPKFNIEYREVKDDYIEYRFTIQSEENYYCPVVMRVPTGMETGKHPVMICLQGHSTGFHISLGIPRVEGDEVTIAGGDRDFVVRAVKEGYIGVAIEQRCFGECTGLDRLGGNCNLSSVVAMLSGRTTIGERSWDCMRTIDALLEHFDFVDPDKICLMGNSGGGTATYYTACLEERIALAMPSCAVCSWDMSVAAKRHCTCNYVPNIAKYFDMGDIGGMIAPRKLVIVHGITDVGFFKPGVDKSYNIVKASYESAGCPENCDLVTGPDGHRFYADLSWPVVHHMMGI